MQTVLTTGQVLRRVLEEQSPQISLCQTDPSSHLLETSRQMGLRTPTLPLWASFSMFKDHRI